MQKYYSEIQESIKKDDAKLWQVQLAKASVAEVQAFQEKAVIWFEW